MQCFAFALLMIIDYDCEGIIMLATVNCLSVLFPSFTLLSSDAAAHIDIWSFSLVCSYGELFADES